jgi:hypothetical protein
VNTKTKNMLQSKDIKNIWELKNGFTHSWVEPEFIASSLKLFSFSQLSKAVSEIKQKGTVLTASSQTTRI